MPLSEIYRRQSATRPRSSSSASVRQLEALTALAAAPGRRPRARRAFRGAGRHHHASSRTTAPASSSSSPTTARTPAHPLLLVEHPARVRRALRGRRPTRARRSRALVERGVRIEVGELGFAAYYPPSHYHLLDELLADRFKADLPRPAPDVRRARVARRRRAVRPAHDARRRVPRPHLARRPALGPRARPPQRAARRRLRAPGRAAHRAPARRREARRAGRARGAHQPHHARRAPLARHRRGLPRRRRASWACTSASTAAPSSCSTARRASCATSPSTTRRASSRAGGEYSLPLIAGLVESIRARGVARLRGRGERPAPSAPSTSTS